MLVLFLMSFRFYYPYAVFKEQYAQTFSRYQILIIKYLQIICIVYTNIKFDFVR